MSRLENAAGERAVERPSLAREARSLAASVLCIWALAAAGMVVAAVALTVGIVGSPLILAAAVAYVVVRRRAALASPSAPLPAPREASSPLLLGLGP